MKRVKALLQRVGPLVILLPALCMAACAGNPTPLADESWLPMPTRVPTPTAITPTQILKGMEPALLAGNPEEAAAIWERAADMDPDHPMVLREGARLALALGDLETAASRAWLAVIAAPQDATAWALLGTIQQRQGEITLSQQSLSTAQALDPELQPALFPARWQAARRADDAEVLTELARAYLLIHPQDPLTLYYRTEAL
ncbi:MAG: tetratricopeptide repeat protein, partial [Anaerolineae bacterium]